MFGSQRPRRSRATHASRSCRRARPSRGRTRPTASRACAAPRCSRTNSSYGSGSERASACPRANGQDALGEAPSPICATAPIHAINRAGSGRSPIAAKAPAGLPPSRRYGTIVHSLSQCDEPAGSSVQLRARAQPFPPMGSRASADTVQYITMPIGNRLSSRFSSPDSNPGLSSFSASSG